MMEGLDRSSGILLHISSLPGNDGIGTIGQEAYQWIDFLSNVGIKYWQILPLNPTGNSNSPYQGLSAFAGNPLFIDLQNLIDQGLLHISDIQHTPRFPLQKVDFQKVISWKPIILRIAFNRFCSGNFPKIDRDYDQFKESNSFWLHDFSLFMSLRDKYKMDSWNNWPAELRLRKPKALKKFEKENHQEIEYQKFLQFLFFSQLIALKSYANTKGVQLIGDIPIFMGYESADVWVHPHLFQLDKDLKRLAVAGVPPDFFSATGQLWGNPLYDWQAHKKEDYQWWISRVQKTLLTVDLIRLDHFRGFAGYYRIPAGSKSAECGEWVTGPGEDLFDTLFTVIGRLPFIAEDLGVITEDVIALRNRYNFPGMRLVQFAFGRDADHEFLPHNYPNNCIAYTGTHDTNTIAGWYRSAQKNEKRFCTTYLGGNFRDIAHKMIRMLWRTNAHVAIAPLQDFLQIGSWARMNLPASSENNWIWRMKPGAVTPQLAKWIKEINITFNRASGEKNWKAGDYFKEK